MIPTNKQTAGYLSVAVTSLKPPVVDTDAVFFFTLYFYRTVVVVPFYSQSGPLPSVCVCLHTDWASYGTGVWKLPSSGSCANSSPAACPGVKWPVIPVLPDHTQGGYIRAQSSQRKPHPKEGPIGLTYEALTTEVSKMSGFAASKAR